MSETLAYIGFFLLFFILELIYFRLALRYRIIDKPNERSSHLNFTIRGGGIIFPLAVVGWSLWNGFQHPLFVTGLVLIAVVSFIDDLEHIHTKIRFIFQLIALTLMLYQLPLDISWFWFPVIFFMLVGTVNAYNFMDGINGITGLYSLSIFLPFLWLNKEIHFIDNQLLVLVTLALLVFGFFNFRKKAKCFAGDIGSISLAFIICFLILNLILVTSNFSYILFLLIYGLDAATTLLFRLIRKENIFEAHRSHFYQFLANEKKMPHLMVASLYATAQLLINILLIQFAPDFMGESLGFVVVLIAVLGLVSVLLRLKVEGRERLLINMQFRESKLNL